MRSPIGPVRMVNAAVIAGIMSEIVQSIVISQLNAAVSQMIVVASFGFSFTRSETLFIVFARSEVIVSISGKKFCAIVSLILFKLLLRRINFHSAVSVAILLKSL